jgi:hypothetical protein
MPEHAFQFGGEPASEARPVQSEGMARLSEPVDIENLDLSELAGFLRQSLDAGVAIGVVVGLTLLRDLVAEHLSCSLLQAERIVETMVDHGFIILKKGPGLPAVWHMAN